MTWDESCRSYIQLHAKTARLKARMEPLRETILAGLRDGKKSPRDLPYTLQLRTRLRVLADWKKTLQEHLTVWLGNEALADEKLYEIEGTFPTREDEALVVEINKSYAAKIKASMN